MADYSSYGLLVDFKYCTNCHTCEVACQAEKNLSAGEFGIKVFENGPYKKQGAKMDDAWEWSYIPVPTYLCDLCADRLDAGRKPMCVKHCLAACMEYGPMTELAKRSVELGNKVAIFKPMGGRFADIGVMGPEVVAAPGFILERDTAQASGSAAVGSVPTGDSAAPKKPTRVIIEADQVCKATFLALDQETRLEFLQGELACGKTQEEILNEIEMDTKEFGHYAFVFLGNEVKSIPKRNTI